MTVKSISHQKLLDFIKKAWEMGIEVSLNPNEKKITIWSGPRKYETIAVSDESSVDELVSYLSKKDEPVEL